MSYFSVLKGLFNNITPKEVKVDDSGSIFVLQQSIPSVTNNTTASLSAGQSWSGSAELNTYRDAMIVCKTDASGTLYADFSPDGTNWDSTLSFTLSAGSPEFHIAEKGPRYYRTRISSSGNQSYLRLYTYYGEFRQGNLPLNATISSDADSIVVRSVITGQDAAGNYRNANTDSEGHIKVNIDEPLTAFGELQVAEPFPVSQVDFVYGINTAQLINTASNGAASVTSTNGLLIVATTGSNTSGSAYSTRYLKYRPGQGAMGRFTALFTTGVFGNNQYAGLSNPSQNNMIAFGYSGSSFGIWHRSSGSFTNFISQSSWNEDVMDGTLSLSNPSGQLLDPTKGNVYQVKYQYLGFGNIYCFIENSETGDFQTVHQIKYPNSNTVTSFRNPSFNLLWATENLANTTNVQVKAGSGALFAEGIRRFLGPRNSFDNNKTIASGATSNILSIKNCTSYNGTENRAQIRIRQVSLANSITGINPSANLVLNIVKNLSLATPTFIALNGTTGDGGTTITSGQSIVSTDIVSTSTTISAPAYTVFNTSLSGNNAVSFDLSDLDIYVSPGETLSFVVRNIASSATVQTSISINWNEDI